MPLDLAALTTSPGLPGAGDRAYPPSLELAAHEWAVAAGAWAAGIVPPSTTVATATATLEAALVWAFRSEIAATAIDDAFAAFATTIAIGMLPMYTATPPPAPLGIATLFSTRASTRAEGVAKVATRLDAWMRTGVAVLVAPPKTGQAWT